MRPTLTVTLTAAIALMLAPAGPVLGQSLQDRIDHLRHQRLAEQNDRARQNDRTAQTTQRRLTTRQRMRQIIRRVELDQVPARNALQWWSEQTGLALVVNWPALQDAGLSADTPIQLRLRFAPARDALRLILKQLARGQAQLIQNVTPWYVEIITRRQANRRPQLHLYDVRDLLMQIPNFNNAPQFDLRNALEGRSRDDRGQSDDGLFGDDENDDQRVGKSKAQRAEELVTLITETVEPDLWKRNGGRHASIRYFRGMLIVNAPHYVHKQIGTPTR
jgi:hypothetical protein